MQFAERATTLRTIPFKSRKKTCLRTFKSNVENVDILNTKANVESTPKKRRIDSKNSADDDVCSTKISRLANNDENSQNRKTTPHIENGPKPLPSRETEIDWLDNFLSDHLQQEKSGSVYISGQPGTGKTACLTYILQLSKFREGYTQVYVNCTMVKTAASIYGRICKELKLKPSSSTEKACLAAIEKYLRSNHKMTLLVLDEMDQLASKRQAVLYSLFSWPAHAGSRLVLVGVANALDLTERALPRLQARCSLRPHTLHFAPYTKQQIINIFTTMLSEQDRNNVFSPVALQMLAAKISAISGDMRRALDIGRRVIDLAKRSKFAETQSVDSMMKDSTVTVELKQVLEVLNDVYGGSTKIKTDVDNGLPMQQKLILCSLMLIVTKGKNKEVTIGRLHDVYKRVANARNIAPLELCEAVSVCSLLEARGALRLGGGGGGTRARRLRLAWDEAELAAALADTTMLASILADTACLNTH